MTEHLYVRGTCNPTSNPWDGPTTEGAAEITDSIFALVEPSIDGQPEWGRTSCPPPGTLLIPGPGCGFAGNHGYPATLNPGSTTVGSSSPAKRRIEFNPGVYYLAGGGLQYQGNASSSFAVVGGTDGHPGRALFFSTGNPTYAGVCALDPTFPQNLLPSTPRRMAT